tara:strand:- start:991 stop:1101 length:111 start_codon:yes stop_codon:yes gene_type:complete
MALTISGIKLYFVFSIFRVSDGSGQFIRSEKPPRDG